MRGSAERKRENKTGRDTIRSSSLPHSNTSVERLPVVDRPEIRMGNRMRHDANAPPMQILEIFGTKILEGVRECNLSWLNTRSVSTNPEETNIVAGSPAAASNREPFARTSQ